MKRTWLALTLVLVLLFAALPVSLAEYNTIQWPLVREGDAPVTLTVACQRNFSLAKIPVEESWFWNYLTTYSGITFDITAVSSDALSERKNLMFAGDMLPDILLGMDVSTTEMVKYGVGEGQLLALEDYITEDIMPNVTAWLEAYPEAKALCTAPDGHMYTLPAFRAVANAVYNTTNVEINTAQLKELGLERPATLDELVEALYAFKAAYPDSTPIPYNSSYGQVMAYILRAHGFVSEDANGLGFAPALRDGEVVLPLYDDLYGEFLTLVRQLYVDGIFSPDMFTTDTVVMKADIAAGKTLLAPLTVYSIDPTPAFFQQFECALPLSSAYCEKGIWPESDIIKLGGVAVSADTQYPELCCRLLDFFWSDYGGLTVWQGPMAGTEETLGIIQGWTVNEGGAMVRLDVGDGAGQWPQVMEFVNSHMGGWSTSVGNRSNSLGREAEGFTSMDQTIQEMAGLEVKPAELDPDRGQHWVRMSKEATLPEYITAKYPSVIYMDEETFVAVSDLNTVIKSYAEAEVAKFITGVRDVSEFPKFQEELRAMGIEELLGYYQAAYDNYLRNLE